MKDFLLNFFGALFKSAFLPPQMRQLPQSKVNQGSFIFFIRSKGNKEYLLNVGSAYCHMTKHGLDTCGGGGWTLVMKIDGSKVLKVQYHHKQL